MNALGYVLALIMLVVTCYQSYWRGYYQQKWENSQRYKPVRPSGEEADKNIMKIIKSWKL